MSDNTTQRTTFNPIIGSGRIMTPTANLRFISRDGFRILQQCWVNVNLEGIGNTIGEWLDVPLEKDFIDKESR